MIQALSDLIEKDKDLSNLKGKIKEIQKLINEEMKE